MLQAQSDNIRFYENHLSGDPLVFKVYYGDLFYPNGNGYDLDSEGDAFSIVAINGLSLDSYPSSPPLVAYMTPSGTEIDIDASTGSFAFLIGDRYDWLPAGRTATETLTYSIRDVNGEESTATATFTVIGIDSDDRFVGTAARDVFYAGIGNDTLIGAGGNDFLVGMNGRDVLYGGIGADDFVYTSLTHSGTAATTRDTIMDFQRGTAATGDDIDLRLIDAKTGTAGNDAFSFIGAQAFHRVKGELRVLDLGPHLVVQGDVNGDARADFSILVANVATLGVGDFLL